MSEHVQFNTEWVNPTRFALACRCGWNTGQCESWEQAGRYLDNHIATAEKKNAD